MYRLILASASPRRQNLLENAGFRFQVVPMKISEIPDEKLNVNEQILDIARRKSRACFEELKQAYRPGVDKPFVVLGADTEVIFGGRPLGKPSSAEEAMETLRRLSSNVHVVITALSLIESSTDKEASHIETTEIKFRSLSEDEIRAYVATGDPLDKAGSYGIQSGAGHFVERIAGSMDNVIGLPVDAVAAVLKKNGWVVG